MEWDPSWNRLSTAEWIGAPTLAVTSLSVRFLGPDLEPNWNGGILFDEALYLSVAPHEPERLRTIANISHAGFFGAMAYRLIDDLLIVGAAYDSWDVAAQMFGMDLEALAIVATALWIPQLLVRRERPIVGLCDDDEYADNKCDPTNPERSRSFWAGHPATATAVAGMTCAHHHRLQIYGGVGDGIACAAMIGIAALTGVTRAVAGYHWPTDVLAGFIAGTVAWVVPVATHYGFGRSEQQVPSQTTQPLNWNARNSR